ncbi:Lysophospholipase 1 [Orbilia javanica]|uniref:Lysophospholipase n=1 Tax=Orbilia javanica TaxID=47235 RepID=A0AAN8R952_9PEZI
MRVPNFGRDVAPSSSMLLVTLTTVLFFTSFVYAVPAPRDQTTTGKQPTKRNLETREIIDHIKSFFGFNTNTGYGPFQIMSPAEVVTVRRGGHFAKEEAAWVNGRMKVANTALTEYLGRVGMEGFDHKAFMKGYTPTVGLAFSGGGYRAMLNGAGVISAFDSRNPKAMGPGGLGGLLQGATYLSGLSGGGWLVGSMVVNGFPTIGQIQNSERLWKLEDSIFSPLGKSYKYYPSIFAQAKEKLDAGFDITLTDIWSLMLSRVFIDKPDGGPKLTLSSIANCKIFRNFQMPFPMFLANGRTEGDTLLHLNATVFEINPLEFGSHDPSVNAFSQTKLLGSDYHEGKPEEGGKLINGFDNAAFVMGTSSSLFNQVLIDIKRNDVGVLGGGFLKNLVISALEYLSKIEFDIADWTPNPFFGFNPEHNPNAVTKNLTLVDGGLDLENIPFNPHLVPHRGVDVVFANDNSADVIRFDDGLPSNWPNGTSMVATYKRFKRGLMAKGSTFPEVPDIHTFINKGLNNRITWFGCDAKKVSANPSPLVVYIPNAPYTAFSNTSTFKMAYKDFERDMLIDNGYMVATQGDGELDPEWPACVGCAVVHREMERRGTITEQCRKCLRSYCWDGTKNSTKPGSEYEPDLKLKSGIPSTRPKRPVALNGTYTFVAAHSIKRPMSPYIEDSTDYSRFRDYA